MSPVIYNSLTLVLYGAEVWIAIVVASIGNVFGFIGAIGGSSLSFFIPSVIYCRAYSLHAKNESKTLYWCSVVNFYFGIVFFGFLVYANILALQ
jgi:hypothetical protein